MKIAYINQLGAEIRIPPFNGPANHIRQVVRGLNELGHEVTTLIGLNGSNWITDDLVNFRIAQEAAAEQSKNRLFEKGLMRARHELHLPYIGWFDNQKFSRVCQNEFAGFDIILERISWMGYGATLAAKSVGIPLVVEFNGDPLHDLDAKKQAPTGLQRKIAINRYRYVLKNASKIIASGTGWRDNLINKWKINTAKIATIENGTTLVDQLRREDLKSFQNENTSSTEVTIIYLGGFYPWHGTNLLLNAIKTNLTSYPNLKLIMIGAGDGLKETQNLVSQLGLQNVVEFTGQLSSEKFAPILANADIAVSPYCGWVEYSGLKLFDYKASGLAIIASGENGAPVTLKHGETGWIIPPCNLQALTDAIHYLIFDRNLRLRLGQSARKDAEINNTWKITTNRIENLLKQTITSKTSIKNITSKGITNE